MDTSPGTRLRHLRELLGYKGQQQDFADKVGLTQQSISNMERDKTEPAAKSLNKIYAAFPQVNINWLVLGQGEPLATGRALTPAPASASEPDPPHLTSTAATVGHATELMLRGHMEARIQELSADKDRLLKEVVELRDENRLLLGKPADSSDAADELGQPEDPTSPPAPVRGVLPLPRLRVQVVRGFRSYQDAAELS